MTPPAFVADFDSATGLVRALAAALDGRRYERLGRSRTMGTVVRASNLLPTALRKHAFAVAGGREAIAASSIAGVDPEAFARWVTGQYGMMQVPAVAIGSANGAVTHLCAAAGVPWLPQTFLVPVRREADPDDCTGDTSLASVEVKELLDRQSNLQVHQMHDPNQDRLMIARLAYFRMKLRGLPSAYRSYLRTVLRPGGTIVIVDCGRRWPVHTLGDRHVYQLGAEGGLAPQEYTDGSPRVAEFLAREGASVRSWSYPPADSTAPEAEWGYEPALTSDLVAFAERNGFEVARLSFPSPEAVSPVAADLIHEWHSRSGPAPTRLLAETFICVEPTWTQQTRTVPLWLTFGTEPSLATLDNYLQSARPQYEELDVTLFSHGVRSAGYAPAWRWRRTGAQHGLRTTLVGVSSRRWPADFATLANYARALHRSDAATAVPPQRLPLSMIEAAVRARGGDHEVAWSAP